jgi:hypothetical protein
MCLFARGHSLSGLLEGTVKQEAHRPRNGALCAPALVAHQLCFLPLRIARAREGFGNHIVGNVGSLRLKSRTKRFTRVGK